MAAATAHHAPVTAPARKRPCLAPAFCLETVAKHAHTGDEPASRGAAQCDAISCVMTHLYLGSWRDSADIELLRREGITHVLDCAKENDIPVSRLTATTGDPENGKGFPRSESDSIEAAAAIGITSKKLPMVDDHSQDIDEHLDAAFDFIEQARHAHGKVLVHCRRGISRSPAVVVAYLMRLKHMTYEDAVSQVKSVRHTVSLNLAFREFLSTYDPEALRRERSNMTEDSHHHSHGSSKPHDGGSVPFLPTPNTSPGTE